MIEVVTQTNQHTQSRAVAGESKKQLNAREARGAVGDSVELSSAARTEVASADDAVREDLVQRVRAEIEAGTYLTDDKLDVVVDRLHRELRG